VRSSEIELIVVGVKYSQNYIPLSVILNCKASRNFANLRSMYTIPCESKFQSRWINKHLS
jgi:hypothetical protein